MIDEAKRTAAMEGLHRLLIAARFRAYTVEPAPSIADILDTAEFMLRCLIDAGESTAIYRECLVKMAGKYEECRDALRAFDEGNSGS